MSIFQVEEETFPGIPIERVLISPSTGEVFFVDGEARIFDGVSDEDREIFFRFFQAEDLELLNYAKNAPSDVPSTYFHTATDNHGNFFHMIIPYNQFVFNSAFLTELGEITTIDGEYFELYDFFPPLLNLWEGYWGYPDAPILESSIALPPPAINNDLNTFQQSQINNTVLYAIIAIQLIVILYLFISIRTLKSKITE